MANNNKNGIVEPRVNHEIKGYTEVRLIYKENKDVDSKNDFNKVVPWKEAIRLSNEKKLDLIEINGNINPPIIKLYDYSKYLYELKKSLKQKNKKTTETKEIQLKTNIASHDLEIKVRRAKEFIEDGHKVRVVLTMKGRELSRREESKRCFYQFINDMLEGGGVGIENSPKDEDKKAIVVFKKK